MKIFKYKLEDQINNIEIPKNSKILTADSQNDEVMLWAIVNEENETETRRFHLKMNGISEIEKGLIYI